MNSCKNFARKNPMVIVILTPILVFALLYLVKLFPKWDLSLGMNELFMAVVVFLCTFLFMGKEKVDFQLKGFGYAFRLFRAYFVALTVFSLFGIASGIYSNGVHSKILINILNVFLIGITVGIVEDFTFRGLVFGGILQKIGNRKKDIFIAAVVSSLLFGAMHIAGSAFAGEISSTESVILAVLKTVQTGVFGIVLAFIYLKTRNIYAIAALHGLNDFLLFIISAFGSQDGIKKADYVNGQTESSMIMYVIFTIIMIPMLIKCIKDIEENEPIPFDDDFIPRVIKYKKKTKKAHE